MPPLRSSLLPHSWLDPTEKTEQKKRRKSHFHHPFRSLEKARDAITWATSCRDHRGRIPSSNIATGGDDATLPPRKKESLDCTSQYRKISIQERGPLNSRSHLFSLNLESWNLLWTLSGLAWYDTNIVARRFHLLKIYVLGIRILLLFPPNMGAAHQMQTKPNPKNWIDGNQFVLPNATFC